LAASSRAADLASDEKPRSAGLTGSKNPSPRRIGPFASFVEKTPLKRSPT